MMEFNLGKKGQWFSAGMSLAYAFVLFVVSIFCIGLILMVVSDNIIGIYFHDYAIQFGADSDMLGYFEFLRTLLPFFALLSFGLGLAALSHGLS